MPALTTVVAGIESRMKADAGDVAYNEIREVVRGSAQFRAGSGEGLLSTVAGTEAAGDRRAGTPLAAATTSATTASAAATGGGGRRARAGASRRRRSVPYLTGPMPDAAPGSRILDTSVVRTMAGTRAQAAEAAATGTPLALTGMPERVRAFDVAQGGSADYRTTAMGAAELEPARGIGKLSGVALDVPRNDPAYRATLTGVPTGKVGEGGGEAAEDRAMVADALHAKVVGVGPATLVIADVS